MSESAAARITCVGFEFQLDDATYHVDFTYDPAPDKERTTIETGDVESLVRVTFAETDGSRGRAVTYEDVTAVHLLNNPALRAVLERLWLQVYKQSWSLAP